MKKVPLLHLGFTRPKEVIDNILTGTGLNMVPVKVPTGGANSYRIRAS